MRTRLSDESGYEAGARNKGRLLLAFIPAALGGAAILWLVAAFGWIDLGHANRLEQRTLQSVGVAAPPKAPVVVVLHNAACLRVDSAFMEGKELRAYFRNACARWLTRPNYSYRIEAHGSVVIESGTWAFDDDKQIGPDEKREQIIRVRDDPRIEQVQVYALD